MESVEDRGGMEELLRHRVQTGPKDPGPAKTISTFNAMEQAIVYVKCFQKLLQAQAQVVNEWFRCSAYDSVLKQVWTLMLQDCKLMDSKFLYGYESSTECSYNSGTLLLRPGNRTDGFRIGTGATVAQHLLMAHMKLLKTR